MAAALDAAAARWPEVRSRRELLLRLVERGREVIDRDHDEATARRRDAIRRTSGTLTRLDHRRPRPAAPPPCGAGEGVGEDDVGD